jgi:hypothetical protein
VPLKSVHDRAGFTLTARVSSPWSAALENGLDLTLKPGLAATPVHRQLSTQRGSLWYWIVALLLIAALAVLAVRWRRGRLSPRLHGSVLIDQAGAEPRVLPLSGHRVQLSADATGLPGSGEITVERAAVRSTDLHLLITYSPDGSAGSRASGACAPGETVSVAGTSFTWQATILAQQSRVTPTLH